MNDSVLIELQELVSQWKSEGHKVVFTNGVFDLLHPGHLYCLSSARSFGTKLIVAINSDESVKALEKGANRPIESEEVRAQNLSDIDGVDAVLVFTENTPLSAIVALMPHVLVKGGDYLSTCDDKSDPKYIVGSQEVKDNGGYVETISILAGHSTTDIIKQKGL
jgi:rfaE bifunctional protein nucleotidyltransferase chain/domain|tara:strand:- start:167 stop:658 length:492 start_codon:yes stop_codon:yes gene_type:complete